MIADPVALGAARDAFLAARVAHHRARLVDYPIATAPHLTDLAAAQRDRRDALVRFFAFLDTLETFYPITRAMRAHVRQAA
jgi:hypothetical protein